MEHNDQPVLITEQLAEFYECKVQQIKQNFNNNKEHFIKGKHYFKIEGKDLKHFKSLVENFDLPINKFAPTLYLWTKQGTARHVKMLSTEKAWKFFELLEENYFNSKEKIESKTKNESAVVVLSQPMLKSTIADISLKDAASIMKTMINDFGVKQGIAMAKALSVVERLNEIELYEIKELIPPAEHEVGYLTPTQIRKLIDKTAQYINLNVKSKCNNK